MLKKLLSILCLITIVFTVNCMKKELDDATYIEEQLDFEIANKTEEQVILFLQSNMLFIENNLELVFKKIFENNLNKVFQNQINLWSIEKKNLINWAVQVGNIEWVKKLIHFNDFLNQGQLDITDLSWHLKAAGLNMEILHEICIYDKINYMSTSGERYLQILIENNENSKNSETILRFIEGLSPAELNAQDSKQSTAFQAATMMWLTHYSAENENETQIS